MSLGSSEIIIFGCVGSALASSVVTWAICRGRRVALEMLIATQKESAIRQENLLNSQIVSLSCQTDTMQERITDLSSKNAALESEIVSVREFSQDRETLLAKAEEQLGKTFWTLGNEILERSQNRLSDQDQKQKEVQNAYTQALLSPLAQSIEQFRQQISALEVARQGAYSELSQVVKTLCSDQIHLQEETRKLVQALRAPTGRGQWGEMQLRRVVELAGMQEYCDFKLQDSVTSEDGQRFRPDLLVKLPGDRVIIVDSKAPMQAYLQALEAVNDQQRMQLLKDHARQVANHLKQLGSKTYYREYEGRTPEFVVMFLPSEAFFHAALEADPSLIDAGVAQGVIMATPTTLIALLRAVAFGWQQEALAANAREISKSGKRLYDCCVTLREHFQRLGKSLEGSVKHFNSALSSMDSRLMPAAKKLGDLGAVGTKNLPEESLQIDVRPTEIYLKESEISPELENVFEKKSLENSPQAILGIAALADAAQMLKEQE